MAASLTCSFFFDAEPVGEPGMPAQDACALCAKSLARDSDVFMYRGDTPFCSEDCRDEQMRLDAKQAAKAAARRQRQFSSATASLRGHRESRGSAGTGNPGRLYLSRHDLRGLSPGELAN